MAIDDLLRESLRGEPTALADPDGWDDVRARGASIRRRRSIGRGATAVVTAAALVVGVLLVVDHDDTRRSVATTPPGSEIVAAIDGRVEVLSAADGRVVRTLAEAPFGQSGLGATAVAPTPDGSTVYFERGEQCGFRPSIWRVSTTGGPAEQITDTGRSPVVSPDGRSLAYATSSADPPGDCGPFDVLVVRDLVSGTERRLPYPQDTGTVSPLAWAPDSTRLVIFAATPDRDRVFASIDVTADALREVEELAEPAGNGYEFLPSGEPVTAFPSDSSSRIATFDTQTGAEQRLVAEVARPLSLVGVDPSGESFLLEGPLADTAAGHDLYQANVGDTEPVQLAERVRSAAWLPAQRATPTPTPGASTEVVAVVGHNTEGDRLVVLSAEDGHEIRTLAEGIGITLGGIAATPDGNTAYFTRLRQGLPCSVIEIARVPLAGGAVETVVSPGSHPVVSPDGRTLAYARSSPPDACVSGGTIALRDLASGQEREINLGPIVQPWSWSPDGTQIVVGTREGEQFSAVTTFGIADLRPTAFLDLPSPAADATYLPDGRLVVAFLDDATGGHRLLTYDAAGAVTGTLFETSTSGIMGICSDASGDLLMHFGGDLLQRWREGEARPTTIATDVSDAAWIPAPGVVPG
jgi:dipeptidyl aminopeptidase/acylaminoacyl peptidase